MQPIYLHYYCSLRPDLFRLFLFDTLGVAVDSGPVSCLSALFLLRQKYRKVAEEVRVAAEEARDLRFDNVGGAMNHLVLVQHGEELFVGVRGGNKALLDFGDVFVGAGELLSFCFFDLGRGACFGKRLGVYSDAMRRGEEQVETRQEIRITLEQQLDAVDHNMCGDSLFPELTHDGEETVVDERAVGEDVAYPLQELHGVFVLHAARG